MPGKMKEEPSQKAAEPRVIPSFRQIEKNIARPHLTALAQMVVLGVCLLTVLAGCSKLRPKPAEQFVYVTAKQTYLRDRVAAVSNRTGTVNNGDKLLVLEKGRRFYRVQTSKGEQGWIDEKAVATQDIFDQFEALQQQHKSDPSVANAVVRDDVYLHSSPGRDTERLFRLSEGEKLKLLRRATLPKPLPPGQRAPKPATSSDTTQPGAKDAAQADTPEPPVMEDWWLVRDSKGDTGWLYSRMMDVEVPDAIGRYSEGQRIVGAYVLTTVNDPEAQQTHRRGAKAVDAAFDRWLVQPALFALQWAIAGRVAVHATPRGQHLAGFREQSRRPCCCVADPGKTFWRR